MSLDNKFNFCRMCLSTTGLTSAFIIDRQKTETLNILGGFDISSDEHKHSAMICYPCSNELGRINVLRQKIKNIEHFTVKPLRNDHRNSSESKSWFSSFDTPSRNIKTETSTGRELSDDAVREYIFERFSTHDDSSGPTDPLRNKKFKCEYCDSKFKTPEEIESHMKTHSNYNEDSTDSIFCEDFQPTTVLKEESSEEEFKPYSKSESRKSTTDTPKKKYNKRNKSKDKNRFQCEFCSKGFYFQSDLHKHIRAVHENYRDYKCTKCEKTYKTQKHLRDHVLSIHENVRCLCNFCGRVYTRKQTLSSHIQAVHLNNPFTCGICNKVCYFKANLRTHIKAVHENYRPFCCDLCGNRFSLKKGLRNHLTTHLEASGKLESLRPYRCPICDKGFKLMDSLKRHQLIHSDARPHICHCGSSFKRKDKLKHHQRKSCVDRHKDYSDYDRLNALAGVPPKTEYLSPVVKMI